jgi:hypothetical protein
LPELLVIELDGRELTVKKEQVPYDRVQKLGSGSPEPNIVTYVLKR